MFGDSDLGVFFDTGGFGVPVVYQGATASGILDTSTGVYMHGSGPGGFERNTVILTLPYNAFSTIPKPLDPITVNGINYTVKELPEQLDMSTTTLYLKSA